MEIHRWCSLSTYYVIISVGVNFSCVLHVNCHKVGSTNSVGQVRDFV